MQQNLCPLNCFDEDKNMSKIIYDLRLCNQDNRERPRTEVEFVDYNFSSYMSRNQRQQYIQNYSSLVERKDYKPGTQQVSPQKIRSPLSLRKRKRASLVPPPKKVHFEMTQNEVNENNNISNQTKSVKFV